MAILKLSELKKMDSKELDKKLRELKLEMAKEKASISIGASVTSPGKIKDIRKTIARIQTLKNQSGKTNSIKTPKKIKSSKGGKKVQ